MSPMNQQSQPEAEHFDPFAGFFLAQAERPAGIESVAATGLTPLQRALLVIDGTVTTFLEAWVLEPVLVTRLWQRPQTLAVPDRWLELPAGAMLTERAVLLSGARSGGFFAFAESRISTGRLSAGMRAALEGGTAGLGQILLASGLESRREGLWCGRERMRALPELVAALTDGDFLTRSYRVTVGGLPLMQITERFAWRPIAVPAAAPGVRLPID
jgi:chorismate-pyruvate lyase